MPNIEIDEFGEVLVVSPYCSYCDEPLTGPVVNNMHSCCYAVYCREMNELFDGNKVNEVTE